MRNKGRTRGEVQASTTHNFPGQEEDCWSFPTQQSENGNGPIPTAAWTDRKWRYCVGGQGFHHSFLEASSLYLLSFYCVYCKVSIYENNTENLKGKMLLLYRKERQFKYVASIEAKKENHFGCKCILMLLLVEWKPEQYKTCIVRVCPFIYRVYNSLLVYEKYRAGPESEKTLEMI